MIIRAKFERNAMSHIYDYLDNHMEVWGAVIFGVLAIVGCIALAVALIGAM